MSLVSSGMDADKRSLLREFPEDRTLEPIAYQGAQVGMNQPRLRPRGSVGGTPVLLVGDAAAQAKVTTVAGTVTRLLGAEAAARSLLKGSSSARELRPLKRELDLL